jgi:hypothetical protein
VGKQQRRLKQESKREREIDIRTHSFGGGILGPLHLLDTIPVSFVRLIVGRVILGLGHVGGCAERRERRSAQRRGGKKQGKTTMLVF